jgi:hypothetical protein
MLVSIVGIICLGHPAETPEKLSIEVIHLLESAKTHFNEVPEEPDIKLTCLIIV